MPTKLNIKPLPDDKVELSWAASAGLTYHVQTSDDLWSWVDLSGPYTGEDNALFTLVVPTVGEVSFFRLIIAVVNGSPVPVEVITAWNGNYVIVNWENLGPVSQPSHYDIFRNSAKIFTAASGDSSYRDSAVSSGATYRYEVRFFYAVQ